MPLCTVHGVTELVAGSFELMYHSSSPFDGKDPPFPLSGLYQKFVAQVPELPFHKLSELKFASNVSVAALLLVILSLPA